MSDIILQDIELLINVYSSRRIEHENAIVQLAEMIDDPKTVIRDEFTRDPNMKIQVMQIKIQYHNLQICRFNNDIKILERLHENRTKQLKPNWFKRLFMRKNKS